MPWSLEGQSVELCSCQSFCICNLGPAVLPQGWHAGACVWDIQRGDSDGVDLAGTTAAMSYDMSGDFVSGDGAARIYIGDAANAEQLRELEAIFTGQRGGAFSFYDTSISNMLPPQVISISLTVGEEPSAAVGDIAQVVLRRHKTESGKQTTLNNAEYLEAFGVTSEQLCDSSGSRWADPDMRAWSGGAGAVAEFTLRP